MVIFLLLRIFQVRISSQNSIFRNMLRSILMWYIFSRPPPTLTLSLCVSSRSPNIKLLLFVCFFGFDCEKRGDFIKITHTYEKLFYKYRMRYWDFGCLNQANQPTKRAMRHAVHHKSID